MTDRSKYIGSYLLFVGMLIIACYAVSEQKYHFALFHSGIALWVLYHSKD
jgi:hypothetical protein